MASAETEHDTSAQAVRRREDIRDFHLTGKRPGRPAHEPLEPVARAAIPTDDPYPLHLRLGASPPFQPLRELLAGAFDDADAAFVAKAASIHMTRNKAPWLPLNEALRPAIAQLIAEKGLEDEAAAKVEAAAQRLLAAVRNPGKLLALAPETPIAMHAALLAASRLPRRTALLSRMTDLADRLEGMLLGESGEVRQESLSKSLGEQADRFIDADRLGKSVKRTSGHRPLGEERRERVEQALHALRRFVARSKKLPLAYLITADATLAGLHAGGGVDFIREADPCLAAIGRFDQMMIEWELALRAARLAELEIEGVYDSELHQRALARFDWQSASAVDVEAAPAFVAVETDARISRRSLTSLGRLLRSGRPLQALVLRDASRAIDLREGFFDPPYLAMAHREALVTATTLAEPEKTAAALERIIASPRPAVAVITVPPADADEESALPTLRALHLARVTPTLIYDPEEGESWAERFSLRDNPRNEDLWPALTPADAAALDFRHSGSFWSIPQDAWSDEQVELREYEDNYGAAPPETVPYIHVRIEGDARTGGRAVMTRDLAAFCHEVARSWRTYQELAGVHNRYVEQAVDETRRLVGAENEEVRERMMRASRQEGAAAAVYRLVQALSNPNGLAAAKASVAAAVVKAPPVASPAASAAVVKTPSEPQPAPAAEPPLAPTEPYVESALCTSCNECINLNPQMFKYNSEKQAYLADPKAGTHKQLLKAAAACPAKCIHPGPPPA